MSVAQQTTELDCWQSFIFLLQEIYIYNMEGNYDCNTIHKLLKENEVPSRVTCMNKFIIFSAHLHARL